MGEMKMGDKSRVVFGYLEKYPEMPSLSLARLIYQNESPLFNSVEIARSAIRYCRGSNGKKNHVNAKKIKPNPEASYNPFDDLPQPLRHFDDWKPYEIRGKMRVGIISDIHIPYHDLGALKIALRYLVEYKPTHIILNGDVADFFSLSFWEKDPRQRDFPGERKAIVQFLTSLKKMFPQTTIIWKDGNHTERYSRFMKLKAPELLGIDELELEQLLSLDKLGITRVKDKRPIMLGEHFYVVHGHEFSFGISSPVNPARGFYMKAKVNCIGGHLHRTSEHSEKTLSGKVISCWSTGSLCDMHPDYAPINGWNHGFATVEVEHDSTFLVHNHKIINGQVY